MGMDVGGKGGVKSDINVTPLVDVMLVLLIIFMVVTPMLQKGQAVKLPMAGNPDKKPDDKSQIMVVVSAERRADRWAAAKLWIDKDPCAESQFEAKLKEMFDRNNAAKLVIKADSHLTYGDVKKVILQVRDAGFKNVGLIAQKKEAG